MPSVPDAHKELYEKFGLEEHREFARRTSGIISGQWAQSVQNFGETAVVYAYRAPSADDINRQPSLAHTKYGQIQYDSAGKLSVTLEDGAEAMIDLTSSDPEKALAYISQCIQDTQSRKIELKVLANEIAEEKRRSSALPGGGVKQMIGIYSDLLDQIKHEHFRQRDLAQKQAQG